MVAALRCHVRLNSFISKTERMCPKNIGTDGLHILLLYYYYYEQQKLVRAAEKVFQRAPEEAGR